MIKSGAPPDKVGVLHHLLPIEFHGFTSRSDSKGYHTLVPGLSWSYLNFCIDGMVPLTFLMCLIFLDIVLGLCGFFFVVCNAQ